MPLFGLISTAIYEPVSIDNRYSFNPILVWFQRVFYRSVWLPSKCLSIPFWSDFNINPYSQTSHEDLRLSIPFWSDFNELNDDFYALENDNFQSHFGLISTESHLEKIFKKPCPFNPILVWFQQSITTTILSIIISLSIPFWSDFNRKKLLQVRKS